MHSDPPLVAPRGQTAAYGGAGLSPELYLTTHSCSNTGQSRRDVDWLAGRVRALERVLDGMDLAMLAAGPALAVEMGEGA